MGFLISFGSDVEWASDFDQARDIAFDWSVEEHGARITIEDERTGQMTEVWA